MAFPVVDTEYLKEIDKVRRDLRALIAFKNCAPIMLRLAYFFFFFFYERRKKYIKKKIQLRKNKYVGK